jgi:hypothetical protein
MNSPRTLDRQFETMAWGLLLVIWGVTIMFDFLPVGIGITGTGLVFLGLNGARLLNGIPTRSATYTLGILALVWGGLELARSVLQLPFEIPVFAILLIVLGSIWLARGLPWVWRILTTQRHMLVCPHAPEWDESQ